MIFPCMEFLFVILQVFHDFQSLWEPGLNLLPEVQSDQGLHCLPFYLHLLDTISLGKIFLFVFWGGFSNNFGVRKFWTFTITLFILFQLHRKLMVVRMDAFSKGMKFGYPKLMF